MKKRLKKLILPIAAAAAVVAGIVWAVASGGPGTQADPLISLSYLNGEYKTSLDSSINGKLDARLDAIENSAMAQLASAGSQTFTSQRVKRDDAVNTSLGTSFILLAGGAELRYSSGAVINLATGDIVPSGAALSLNTRYYTAEDTSAVYKITSDTAVIETSGGTAVSKSGATDYNALADALMAMGLFRGSDNGYELEREATRTEGIIMLIRLLGEESRALSYTGSHPFTDVANWASPYVAWAYNQGYTKGVSDTLFGSQDKLTYQHYMTFILRALGYTEENSGFTWDGSAAYAKEAGILNTAEYERFTGGIFYRAQVVYASYHALSAAMRDSSGQTLLDRLVSAGAVSRSVANEAMAAVSNGKMQ